MLTSLGRRLKAVGADLTSNEGCIVHGETGEVLAYGKTDFDGDCIAWIARPAEAGVDLAALQHRQMVSSQKAKLAVAAMIGAVIDGVT